MDTKTLIKVGMVFADYPNFFSRSLGQRSSRQLGNVMVDLVAILRDINHLSELDAVQTAIEIIHESNWIIDWSDCEEAYAKTKRRGEIYHALDMGSSESPSGEW
jgi:hypothetical protein